MEYEITTYLDKLHSSEDSLEKLLYKMNESDIILKLSEKENVDLKKIFLCNLLNECKCLIKKLKIPLSSCAI